MTTRMNGRRRTEPPQEVPFRGSKEEEEDAEASQPPSTAAATQRPRLRPSAPVGAPSHPPRTSPPPPPPSSGASDIVGDKPVETQINPTATMTPRRNFTAKGEPNATGAIRDGSNPQGGSNGGVVDDEGDVGDATTPRRRNDGGTATTTTEAKRSDDSKKATEKMKKKKKKRRVRTSDGAKGTRLTTTKASKSMVTLSSPRGHETAAAAPTSPLNCNRRRRRRRRVPLASIAPDAASSRYSAGAAEEDDESRPSYDVDKDNETDPWDKSVAEYERHRLEARRRCGLPHNQYEVTLRRRAVRKKQPVEATAAAPSVVKHRLQQTQQHSPASATSSRGSGVSGAGRIESTAPAPIAVRSRETSAPSVTSQQQWEIARYSRASSAASTSAASSSPSSVASSSGGRRSLFPTQKQQRQPPTPTPPPSKTAPPTSSPYYRQEEEEDGDVSLGMKLTILSGKVIVQSLMPLADGRASPAQLAGLIERGDVLLSIDGRSLVHLPIDRLAEGLKPLSSASEVPPPTIDGGGAGGGVAVTAGVDGRGPLFKRELRLRFAVGEGLPLLMRNERRRGPTNAAAATASTYAGAAGGGSTQPPSPRVEEGDIFSFIPKDFALVDQHSGMPFVFHDEGDDVVQRRKKTEEATTLEDAEPPSSPGVGSAALAAPFASPGGGLPTPSRVLQQRIASRVAYERRWDRAVHTSLYFALDDRFPVLLRSPSMAAFVSGAAAAVASSSPDRQSDVVVYMTRGEMMEIGKRASTGAGIVFDGLERADRGAPKKDRDPFAVVKRRGSVASGGRSRGGSSRLDDEGGETDTFSTGRASLSSGGSAAEDAAHRMDERLLVRLAAYDDEWKREVVTSLRDAAAASKKERDAGDRNGAKRQRDRKKLQPQSGLPGIEDSAVSELESLLFGEKVTSMLSKKKSSALPPTDMTTVLFDLSTRLMNSMPDQITVRGPLTPLEEPAVIPFSRSTLSPRKNEEIALASLFVLDQAIPAWLETFHPLPWEQRRALWPLTQASGSPSEHQVGSSVRYDDGLSVSLASASTGWGTPTSRKLALREQIEDLELDAETRGETCYLITFYFTRKLLPQIKASREAKRKINTSTSYENLESAAVEFVEKFGSYLNLYPCLVSAADAKAEFVIDTLIKMAKYDLRHKEATKNLARTNVLLLYEPMMLSALMKRLPSFAGETQQQNDILPLLVAAYPDLKPWQVLKADSAANDTNDFYYNYLSLLLHPEDGNDSARHDAVLVQEFCILSTTMVEDHASDEKRSIGLNNFHTVASKASEDWILYHRDLPVLMSLSMTISDYHLALDLAGEIIIDCVHSTDREVLASTLYHLRAIAKWAISGDDRENPRPALDTASLSRIILLLNMMATSRSVVSRNSISVPNELSDMLQACGACSDDEYAQIPTGKEEAFVMLMAENAAPPDVLATLAKWKNVNEASIVIPALHTALVAGARGGIRNELSGALLRIRRAREEGKRPVPKEKHVGWEDGDLEAKLEQNSEGDDLIWQNVLKGEVTILK